MGLGGEGFLSLKMKNARSPFHFFCSKEIDLISKISKILSDASQGLFGTRLFKCVDFRDPEMTQIIFSKMILDFVCIR